MGPSAAFHPAFGPALITVLGAKETRQAAFELIGVRVETSSPKEKSQKGQSPHQYLKRLDDTLTSIILPRQFLEENLRHFGPASHGLSLLGQGGRESRLDYTRSRSDIPA